ncbi:hypothetical protein [Niveispirillum sp.]|uniref:hypothetical protein n=1 Tax=Niveispirillum sp. TaxID=1917217 RepID=UPI001B6ACCBF|nr:hypothetical protein [Niveispirillum sp.]MBP7336913.1 hypothetical protein [Niveispirillum sp.]
MTIPTTLPDDILACKVQALSILQPWPHHIFDPLDRKDVENRKWFTRYRGWFLVHAGKSDREDPDYIREYQLPMGGIVGIARITDCVQHMDSKWFYGPYGFVLADATPLPLIPCRGMQRFFHLTPEALAATAQAVRALLKQVQAFDDITKVCPQDTIYGQRATLEWANPDCRGHGGSPVKRGS